MTERDLLARLKTQCSALCGERIYLGDAVVCLEQEVYPALYAYHVKDQAKSATTQHGVRQIVTATFGVYCVADRNAYGASADDLWRLRTAVQTALIGHTFPGCLCPMRLVEGYRVKAEALAVVWLDLYAADDLVIREPLP